jgi:hypothetical protein
MPGAMLRRHVLFALASAPILAFTDSTHAIEIAPHLKSIARDALGTTLWLGLEHAPFPAQGSPYRDDTVIVFVPAHFRFWQEEGVSALVHFHGHNTTADRALKAHELREQLADSRQNAILVVPQLAVMAADSSCGKLEAADGLARLLSEVVTVCAREGRITLGDTAFPVDAPLGTVCASAHSGGYHAAATVLRVGGIDMREVYLFDALYAETETMRDWVIGRRGEALHSRHKLVSYFTEGGATEANSVLLRTQLERAGVLCEHEAREGELSRRDLSHGDAVFVRTGLGHSDVAWETNALRDCLFASALPRHLPTSWFASKTGARPLEKRQR